MGIAMTDFARRRLFPGDGRRTAIQDCTAEEFVAVLNEEAPERVLDGYAPFCKLHVHRNWTSTRCSAIAITEDNRHLLDLVQRMRGIDGVKSTETFMYLDMVKMTYAWGTR